MKSSVVVLRAIAAELARRIFVPIFIIICIIAVLLGGLVIWLTTLSAWWWILAVLVFVGLLILAVVLIIVRVIIATINPQQTKEQRTAVKSFVDTLQNLSEITQTPKFILLFRVIRDAVSSRKEGFVETTIGHTLSLRKDFNNLREKFSS